MMDNENKPRVLVVEDHPLIAELVETRLRIEGMTPVRCPGGREAVALIGHEPFDVAILDIMMPDIDGYQVLQQIRPLQRCPQLLLYALRPQRVEHQQRQIGACGGKPFGRIAQRRGGIGMQPCAIERRIQVAADEVVGGRIAQFDANAGDGRESAIIGTSGNVFAA